MEIPKQVLKAAAYYVKRFGENFEYLGEYSDAQLWRFLFPLGQVVGLPVVYCFDGQEVKQLEDEEAIKIISKNEERKAIISGFCKETIGERPHGGARELCYFYDQEGNPCKETEAKKFQILEFDKENNCIFSMITE